MSMPITPWVPPVPKTRSFSVPSVQLTWTVNDFTVLGGRPSPVTAFVMARLPTAPAPGYEFVTVNSGDTLVVTSCGEPGVTVTSVGGGLPWSVSATVHEFDPLVSGMLLTVLGPRSFGAKSSTVEKLGAVQVTVTFQATPAGTVPSVAFCTCSDPVSGATKALVTPT